MKQVLLAGAMASALMGCASSADRVSPSYVSPLEYSNLDCDQIRAELIRVSAHVREVSGVQQRAHTRDEVAMGVGLVIFWPALFFLMEGDRKEELGRLKGQYDALDDAAIQKRCAVADEIQAGNAREAGRRPERQTDARPARTADQPAPAPVMAAQASVSASPPPRSRSKATECGTTGFSTPGNPDAFHRSC
ncbi:MAG TPA: hypothetical protein VGN38_11195 [Caulobacteraceae bacterium]|jgi:hypothetical protein|nr:hypothetical protein [Caulobacteraceae bacterium]